MAAIAIGPFDVLPRFFRWWLGEIFALAPAALKRRFAGATDRLVILPDDGAADCYLESGEELRLLGRVALSGARGSSELQDILRRHSLDRAVAAGGLGVCLRIPASDALRTEIKLPLAAESNLNEVVTFELDRHTPFRADQVAFSLRILERSVPTQRLRVEILLVPRPVVEKMTAAAARLDLKADRIDIAENASPHAASDNLLGADLPGSGRRRSALPAYGLAALAMVLAIAVILLPIVRAQQSANLLARQYADVKQIALRESALRKEIDTLRKSGLFLVARKREKPTVSELLFQTTRLLPDTTWLDDWQISGKGLQLSGTSKSASALVGLLEQSHRFSDTTFLSPVTRDSDGREHFHIATQATLSQLARAADGPEQSQIVTEVTRKVEP